MDIESDTVQHSGESEGNLIKDKTIVNLPNVRHHNDDYMIGGHMRPMTILNVAKIKSKEETTNVIDGYRGPEELKDNTLQETMMLIQYSVMTLQKWQAIECRSALVPLVRENRDEYIKVFELFSFLAKKLREQNEVLQLLKKERLGPAEVAIGGFVEHVLMHHVED